MNIETIETSPRESLQVNKIVFENSTKKKFYTTFKYLLEIILIFLTHPITISIIFIFGILIILESKGKIFYSQERLGLNGKPFKIYKLRSMYVDAEKNGPQWALKNDNRITKVGKFIRKTRIDEIPQLLNVMKGDMTLIGPRPERPEFTEKFQEKIPNFNDRLLVKPGLTGWAQINGGYELTPSEKLNQDLYYIENQSMKLDAVIMFKTMLIVINGNGAR